MSETTTNTQVFDASKIKEEKIKILQERYRNGKSYSIISLTNKFTFNFDIRIYI